MQRDTSREARSVESRASSSPPSPAPSFPLDEKVPALPAPRQPTTTTRRRGLDRAPAFPLITCSHQTTVYKFKHTDGVHLRLRNKSRHSRKSIHFKLIKVKWSVCLERGARPRSERAWRRLVTLQIIDLEDRITLQMSNNSCCHGFFKLGPKSADIQQNRYYTDSESVFSIKMLFKNAMKSLKPYTFFFFIKGPTHPHRCFQ